jgi:hypothetical protein
VALAVVDGDGDNVTIPVDFVTRRASHLTRHSTTHYSHGGNDLVFSIKHAALFVGELNGPKYT